MHKKKNFIGALTLSLAMSSPLMLAPNEAFASIAVDAQGASIAKHYFAEPHAEEQPSSSSPVGNDASSWSSADARGETVVIEDRNGKQHKINKLAFNVNLQKQLEKKPAQYKNSITSDDIEKALNATVSMSDVEMQELASAIDNNGSFRGLSSEELQKINTAYMNTSRGAVGEETSGTEEDPITFDTLSSLFSTTGSLTDTQKAAVAGMALAVTGGAATLAAYQTGLDTKGAKLIEDARLASTRGTLGYKLSPKGMGGNDKATVETIKNFISSTNGDWQGQSLIDLANNITYFATQNGVDPLLITALLRQESGFQPNVGSSAGAGGIAQFMEATAAGMGVDRWDVNSSIEGCCRYIRNSMENFGDYTLALAAYNAGGGAVEKYGGVPPYSETQNYVSSISSMYGDLMAKKASIA